MKRHIANAVSLGRLLLGAGMLFVPVFSPVFCVLYLLGGLSDMVDGMIARRLQSVSRFGERLDSAADLVFACAAFIKILPELSMPAWLWAWTGAVLATRIAVMLLGFIRKKGFLPAHSTMNKLTGAMLFALPFTLKFIEIRYSAPAVCAAASIAAVMDGCGVWKKD